MSAPTTNTPVPVSGSAALAGSRSNAARLTLAELATKWKELQTEGDAFWAEQKRGNKTKARIKWMQAQAVAKRITERVCAQSQWQPIGTAPKDGTKVLLLLKDSNVPHSGYYKSRHYWCIAWDNHILSEADGPTHWMPLPAVTNNIIEP